MINLMPEPFVLFPTGVEEYEFVGPMFHLRNFDNAITPDKMTIVLEIPKPGATNVFSRDVDIKAGFALYTANMQLVKRYGATELNGVVTLDDPLEINYADEEWFDSMILNDGTEFANTDWYLKPIITVISNEGTFSRPEHVPVKYYIILQEEKV